MIKIEKGWANTMFGRLLSTFEFCNKFVIRKVVDVYERFGRADRTSNELPIWTAVERINAFALLEE
jgi:hypothetical protein